MYLTCQGNASNKLEWRLVQLKSSITSTLKTKIIYNIHSKTKIIYNITKSFMGKLKTT